MWVFLNNAMVSAVAHRSQPGVLLVRARVAGDLERFAALAGVAPKVERTPDADYAYRCTMRLVDFSTALLNAARAIDYPNFKASIRGAAGDQSPQVVVSRSHAYHGAWDAMMDLQQNLEPDSGWGAR